MRSRLAAFAGCACAALVAATIVMPGRSVHAQALEPRSYANTPVGINFVLLGYGYTAGDVGFDATSPIQDAKVHVHAGLVAYARSLNGSTGVYHRTDSDFWAVGIAYQFRWGGGL